MKRNLLFIIALFVCALSFGQGEIDAYRYSNEDLSGTARGQAMGGAFGALGGDVTGVAINPAGIGIYRSSELVANMSLKAPLLSGKTNQQSNTKFNFDNLSYIYYYPLIKGSMLSLNFGFNYNRIKSFEQRYSASRPAMNSSLTDYMEALANNANNKQGIPQSVWGTDYYYSQNIFVPWLSALGYDGFLLNPRDENSSYYSTILSNGEKVSPSLQVMEKGKVEAYDFTIGSNVMDKFYWGATLTFVDLTYLMSSFYDESFGEGGGMKLQNYLETKGSGFQLKAGVIYKPTDALRLGVAYHSPVWYTTITDYYQAWLTPRGITYQDDKGQDVEAGKTSTPDDESFNYLFRAPGSWTFSAAAVLGAKAIVSVDYEIKDYSSMYLQYNNGDEIKDQNGYIKKDYKTAFMLRAGLEYRFTPQLSGRLGYALSQNPYRSDIQSTGNIIKTVGTVPHYALSDDVNYLTAGLGFRFTPQFYVDAAVVLRTQKDNLYYFTPENGPNNLYDSFQDTYTNRSLKGLVTFGYKF